MADKKHEGHHHPDLSNLPSDAALRVRALESLLVEKGLARPETIDKYVEKFEHEVGPHNGARVVARSWVDAEFRKRLFDNATLAIEDMGVLGAQASDVVAVENTNTVHNVVVCTLCSCYPWTLLGIPPSWYKSHAYRSRVVREPRAVLEEFGVGLAEGVEVRVWDSTAEIRYLVVPQRPHGTENMSEKQLAALVSRDSMIGAARVEA
jgi:nitrile hydratase